MSSKKSSFRKFSYYSDQWGAYIYLLIGSKEDFMEHLKKKLHSQWKQQWDPNCDGFAFRILTNKGIRKGYCIYLKSFQGTIENYVTLSHQCIHTASDILTDRGVSLQDQGKEALTYTHDALYRHFLERIN